MTCTETRRQLPEPEPAVAARSDEHLEACTPCRSELDSLREVDRRLYRLGEARRAAAQSAWVLLQSPGSPGSFVEKRGSQKRAPGSSFDHQLTASLSRPKVGRGGKPARRSSTSPLPSSALLRLSEHVAAIRGFVSVSVATLLLIGLFWLLWRLLHGPLHHLR